MIDSRTILVASVAMLAGAGAAAQESAQYFDTAVVELDKYHRYNELLDWSGDGRVDAMGFWRMTPSVTSFTVTGYLGGGDRFTPTWSLTQFVGQGVYVEGSTKGRIDGDALDDFAIFAASKVFVYQSNGALPPALLATLTFPNNVRGVAIADFDGDGLGDVAAMGGGELRLYRNQGGGSFALVATLVAGVPGQNDNTDGLTAAELTGDALPDLVFSVGNVLQIVPVLGTAFGTTIGYFLGGSHIMDASGDVDGDGDVDVVAFSKSGFQTTGAGSIVLRRISPFQLIADPEQKGGPATDLGDVDLDGDLDGVCCSSGGGDPTINYAAGKFEIALNDGTGKFAVSFAIDSVGSNRIAGVTDVDLDGDPDLVAGRCVYYSHGGVIRDPSPDVSPDAFATQFYPSMVKDADGDGDPDLFGNVQAEMGLTGWYRNSGDGRMTLHSALWPAAPPNTQLKGPGFPGDYDGDGDTDLMVLQQMIAPGGVSAMRLLRNTGGGEYVDGGQAGPANFFWNNFAAAELVIEADADGDGDLDALLDHGNTGISWNSGGMFGFPTYLPDLVIGVHDLNADGWPDLVCDTTYLLGQGGQSFGPPIALAVGVLEDSVPGVGDFDNDGDLDIVVNLFPGAGWIGTALLVNDGNANFTETHPFGALGGQLTGASLALAVDVDGDGLLDCVRGDWWAQGSSLIQLRSGDNSGFAPPVTLAALGSTVADFDGDGDEDVVGQHVFLSRVHHGAEAGIRRQYGSSSAGTGGMRPVLGATGPFRVGEQAEIRLKGAVGGTSAVFIVGLTEAAIQNKPFPGLSVLTLPVSLVVVVPIFGPAGVAGVGDFVFSYTVPASTAGYSFFHQAFITDFGTPFSATSTNGLELHYGP